MENNQNNQTPSSRQVIIGFIVTIVASGIVMVTHYFGSPETQAIIEKGIEIFAYITVFGLFGWLMWGLFGRKGGGKQ